MKKNEWFNGKLVRLKTGYVWVSQVKEPHSNCFKDENDELVFRKGGYSILEGKDAYNQTVRFELTPELRKSAKEATWDDFMWDSIN